MPVHAQAARQRMVDRTDAARCSCVGARRTGTTPGVRRLCTAPENRQDRPDLAPLPVSPAALFLRGLPRAHRTGSVTTFVIPAGPIRDVVGVIARRLDDAPRTRRCTVRREPAPSTTR